MDKPTSTIRILTYTRLENAYEIMEKTLIFCRRDTVAAIGSWKLCKPFSQFSSLAFCPAEMTISKGRGAKDDQYSYFENAISAQMPKKHEK